MPSDETIVGEDNPLVQDIKFMPSTIETIDVALYNWINEEVNPYVTTNKGWEKVKIRWVSGERSWQFKADRDIRDSNGRLILPIITIKRRDMRKDPNMKGVAWAHIPNAPDEKGGARSLVVGRVINQKKTSEFANATSQRLYNKNTFPFNNRKIVYQTKTFSIPVYVTMTYDISFRTEYIQQMNEVVTPFLTTTGQINNFFINNDGHRFEGFIQGDLSDNSNASNLSEEERYYDKTLSVKVLGYLIGKDKNDERPRVSIRENAVEVKIPREHVIMGDINEYIKKGFYRS